MPNANAYEQNVNAQMAHVHTFFNLIKIEILIIKR